MTSLTVLVIAAMCVSLTVSFAHAARPSIQVAPMQREKEGSGDASTVQDARLIGELRAAGASAGAAATGPASDFRRRFQMVRTETPPKIDGRLDDEVWSKAAVLDGFLVSQSFNDPSLPHPAADDTEARVLFDDDGLYVGVAAYQDPGTIYTTIKENGWLRPDLDWEQRGEPWANTGCDEMEIVIDGELTMTSHFVFQVNPDGVQKKLYMPPARPEDGFYKRIDPVEVADAAWRSATSRDEKGWYAEVFIPWESIGFRKIRPAGEKDIFVDMVQDRTVMGFNINRVAHERHEPSSWSPSKGTMFFRDAHNFGLAYFAAEPAIIERIECGDFAAGEYRFDVTLRSRSAGAEALSLRLIVAAEGASGESVETLKLAPGARKTFSLAFAAAGPGGNSAEIRLEDSNGRLLDAARYVFEVPAPVEIVCLKSILYKGERDMAARLTVSAPGAGDALRLCVLSGGKAVARVRVEEVRAGEVALPVELADLAVGEYELEAQLVAGRKVTAAARAPFRVIADPFSLKLTGRAGKAQKAKSAAPFSAVADGDGLERTAAAFEGEIPWLDDQTRAQGALVWAVTATADFTSHTVPRRAQLDAPLRVFAAGGEYEAAALAVFAIKDLKDPQVEIDGLRLKGGAEIPAASIDIRVERPDGFLVSPEVAGDIQAASARRYFITVYTAPGTRAGLYSGDVRFTADGIEPLVREMQLLVLPFALAPTPIVGSIYGALEGDAQDGHLAADLLAHGLDNFTCGHVIDDGAISKVMIHHLLWDLYKPTEENWLGEGAERFDAGLDAQVFTNMKELALRGPFIVEVNYFLRYLPCTPENARLFEGALRRIEALREKHGLGEFVYHLVDEPSNHFTYDDGRYGRRYGLERVDFFGKVLNKLGLRQYVTINSTGRGFDTAEKMPDRVDIWCPNIISDEAQVQRWSRPPKELWLYNFAGDGRVKGAARSTYGFYAHRVRAAGVTVWCHPNYVRRDADGRCWGNSAWEAIREGRDDARYVATLKAALAKALSKGSRAAKAAARAEAELDAIIGAYPALTADKVRFERLHDAEDWNKWRWLIARHILKLMGAQS